MLRRSGRHAVLCYLDMPYFSIEWFSAFIFFLALVHTFAAKQFEKLAHIYPKHAGLLHLLGEVEIVFGFWAIVLVCVMALSQGSTQALDYAESRQYTEPMFVFVVMIVAASKPVMDLVSRAIHAIAEVLPMRSSVARVWLGLAAVPLLGSLITEPAAMTIAALMLAPQVFHAGVPERLKYLALGGLFVNVSIGGTLTSYAAPPVLMVASVWQWDSTFMLQQFGWKAVIAVLINASLVAYMLRRHLNEPNVSGVDAPQVRVPWTVSFVHVAMLAGVVVLAHHPVAFIGLFLLFMGFTHAYQRYQTPLIMKEALLVSFFLAGLVVLGGMQQWWLQPLVSDMSPGTLFVGAAALTAFTDNAALTYLGSLIVGISDEAKYSLVAGAVAGGGLTVIANAPNPAGVALLRSGFSDGAVGAGGLVVGALVPTLVAMVAFLL